MAEFKSSIYPKPYDKKPRNSTYGYLISIILLLIDFIIDDGFGTLWLFIPGSFGFIFGRYLNIGEMPIYGRPINDLIINNNGIQFGDQAITLEEITDFNISFRTHYREKVSSLYSLYYRNSGTENYFKVISKHKILEGHFMISNHIHKTDLLKALEHFYEAGIFVNEDGRTYLGKSLSYEEIQKFKQKYGLKGNGYKQ